eukprot:TRINITY_DN8199_c0_g1_i2.p1 TRINITY_DN8199_c0_g1~~TRINITY_DN8199_c0_g1_i2.p1  ORF type:complete len:206 (+),score=58.56 TRINITY_DN8199_c0_g1_i2:62-679(+)
MQQAVALEDVEKQKLLEAMKRLVNGDFSVHLNPEHFVGSTDKELAKTFNLLASRNKHFLLEVQRVGHMVGQEGREEERAAIPDELDGSWRDALEAYNQLVDDLLQPANEVTQVIEAVALGDLSRTINLKKFPPQGKMIKSAEAINKMVGQINTFSHEMTSVIRGVGIEGNLRVQANPNGLSGTWKSLTQDVNLMSSNLNQPRTLR